jgi:succinate dehydrogenase / fumarate reductase, iron-sulfur subunit
MSKSKINLKINRTVDSKTWVENYELGIDEGKSTLLEVLLDIQTKATPPLAVRYGCRYKNCGLCGLTVNGAPRMACMTKVKNNMNVGPLENLHILQDLIVDRSIITETIKKMQLFPRSLNISHSTSTIDEKYEAVSKCTDCQACMSGSSVYKQKREEGVSGPLFFVKLAQLQFHPQNNIDYRKKAIEMGVEAYKDSPAIPCPYGIPIKKVAIDSFLDS